MTLRPILLFPDPILRQKTEEVCAFDGSLERLAAEMAATMYAAPGVGLAAPQIGDLRRIAVVDIDPSGPKSKLQVLVNPRLVARAGAETDVEGCLSIPGFTERIERPVAIRVAAQGSRASPSRSMPRGSSPVPSVTRSITWRASCSSTTFGACGASSRCAN